MKRVLAVSGLLMLMILTVLGSTPKVGDQAPAFALPSSSGGEVSLKDYDGKKVVLVFYRGYW